MLDICGVCNGLYEMCSYCPHCDAKAEDQGKLSDFWGPYSAYTREVDRLMVNCTHLAVCSQCQHTFYEVIK